MLLLTFSVTMRCEPEGVKPICTGVSAAAESETAARDDGTRALVVSVKLPMELLPWLRTSTQAPWCCDTDGIRATRWGRVDEAERPVRENSEVGHRVRGGIDDEERAPAGGKRDSTLRP